MKIFFNTHAQVRQKPSANLFEHCLGPFCKTILIDIDNWRQASKGNPILILLFLELRSDLAGVKRRKNRHNNFNNFELLTNIHL